MNNDYLRPPENDEERFSSEDDYNEKIKSRSELALFWNGQIKAADKVYKDWAERFAVNKLYEYFEGYQYEYSNLDDIGILRPYVINLIHSTIETKLPTLLFNNPQFQLRARPHGLTFDEEQSNQLAQHREDALNYVAARREFGLTDKQELASLDAFFGFGVNEVGYSDELHMNDNIPVQGSKDPLSYIYSKQIPFDHFRVSGMANWDLTSGKWQGYFEFIPYERLEKFKDKLKSQTPGYATEVEPQVYDTVSGKISTIPESTQVITPEGHCKIWKIWDYEASLFYIYAPEDSLDGNAFLEIKPINEAPEINTLRLQKRRKGWYPYPPVWNWLSPQDEINDIRQSQRIHRKRFKRKYLVNTNKFETPEEVDKYLNGDDGAHAMVNDIAGAIGAVQDAPMDPVNAQDVVLTYDDFNRVSNTPDEFRGVSVSSNRTTAKQAGIMDRRATVREAKDALRINTFMCDIGRSILKALRKAKEGFWVKSKLQEGTFGELKTQNTQWKLIPPVILMGEDDYDIDMNVSSSSPIAEERDKQAFMEFMALITQYEILSFSPALLREAAYRVGYKNEAVLNQFQQMAQVMSIGRQIQMQQQVAGMGGQGPQPTGPGQMAQQQTDQSTPPDNQAIMNQIFNRPNG